MNSAPKTPSRACTMCGVPYKNCMADLESAKESCCDVCRDSDTHPSASPDRDLSCAEWAKIHGGPTKEKEEEAS